MKRVPLTPRKTPGDVRQLNWDSRFSTLAGQDNPTQDV